jgi:hypothetical protein
MRKFGVLIAFLMLLPAWGQKALDSESLYISNPLKWERSQNPDQPNRKYALGRILVIEPGGELETISCYLYRTPDKQLHIVYPEGFALSSGTWKKVGGQLAVRFRSIHSEAERLDGTDEQYKEELWSYAPARTGDRIAEQINISAVRYVPLRDLSDLNQLAQIIQFYRKQAEASK